MRPEIQIIDLSTGTLFYFRQQNGRGRYSGTFGQKVALRKYPNIGAAWQTNPVETPASSILLYACFLETPQEKSLASVGYQEAVVAG
jgi:hypothetical protein